MSLRYVLDHPSRVTVGAIGPVGERLFVLQGREDRQLVTIKVEKVQVSSLATYLGRMLRQLGRPHELPEEEELAIEDFESPDFTAESLALTYDEGEDRIVLVVDEVDNEADEEDLEPAGVEVEGSMARFAMTREQAAALAIRATELVEAGRPPCPLCGYPLDPRGHVCPRTNGNSAPLT